MKICFKEFIYPTKERLELVDITAELEFLQLVPPIAQIR